MTTIKNIQELDETSQLTITGGDVYSDLGFVGGLGLGAGLLVATPIGGMVLAGAFIAGGGALLWWAWTE
jgi:hypothetical protein